MKKILFVALILISSSHCLPVLAQENTKVFSRVETIIQSNNSFKGISLAKGVYENDVLKIVKFSKEIISPDMIVLLSQDDFSHLSESKISSQANKQNLTLQKGEVFIYGVKTDPVFVSENLLHNMSDRQVVDFLSNQFKIK